MVPNLLLVGFGDVIIVGVFVWVTGGLVFVIRDLRRAGAFRWLGIRSFAKGVAAVAIWIGLYLFLRWYKSVGFLGYLTVALPVVMLLSILGAVSGQRKGAIGVTAANAFEWMGSTMEAKSEWIIGFWFVVMYGGILYFLLAAPYGVLCTLGLKRCGAW